MTWLFVWLVTAVSLLIISQLPIGVKVDNFGKALFAAAVFGILNAFVKPILVILTLPITLLTLGLFYLVLNVFIFGLTAWLVKGFELKSGFISAVFGAICLSLVNGILFKILEIAGIAQIG